MIDIHGIAELVGAVSGLMGVIGAFFAHRKASAVSDALDAHALTPDAHPTAPGANPNEWAGKETL